MSGHPEIPVRRLTRVAVINPTTGATTDITDSVTEIIETGQFMGELPVVTARYVKEKP